MKLIVGLLLPGTLILAARSSAETPTQPLPTQVSSTAASTILNYVPASGFRAEDAGTGKVIALPNGMYRLYLRTITRGVVAADSPDGLDFSSGVETRLMATDPSIVTLPDGTYRMYYKTNAQGTYHPIYSAFCKDGITWREKGLRLDNKGEPCEGFHQCADAVILSDGRVRVYFVCGASYSPQVRSIVSVDGLTFALEDGVRLSPAADPTVIAMPDGTFRM